MWICVDSARNFDPLNPTVGAAHHQHPEDFFCKPWPCKMSGAGAACKVCRPLADRTGPNQCQECNAGHVDDASRMIPTVLFELVYFAEGSKQQPDSCSPPSPSSSSSYCSSFSLSHHRHCYCVLSLGSTLCVEPCCAALRLEPPFSGHLLSEDLTCIPFSCSTGAGNACNRCRDLARLTSRWLERSTSPVVTSGP